VKREYWIGIVVAALVVVGVVVGISLSGGDDDPPASADVADETQQQLEGLTQEANVLGDAGAPVTIVEYGDIACPACKQISATLIPELIDQHVRTGEAKLEFRPINLLQLASGERGAFAAEAAAFQDKTWSLVTLLYEIQGPESEDWLTDDVLFDAAADAGLDVDQFRADYEGEQVVEAFDATASQAAEDQVQQTPTFYVEGPGGRQEVENLDDFDELIAEVGPQT
jgi:protein-disulfide isomerase